MATPVEYVQNAKTEVTAERTVAGGAFADFIKLDPDHETAILVDKNGEDIKVEVAINRKKVNGDKIDDLEVGVIFAEVDTGTDDYFAGDNSTLSAVKISGTPGSATVNYSVTQS